MIEEEKDAPSIKNSALGKIKEKRDDELVKSDRVATEQNPLATRHQKFLEEMAAAGMPVGKIAPEETGKRLTVSFMPKKVPRAHH